MVFRLSPREEKFFTLLQDAARNIVTGATLLHQIFVEWEDVPAKVEEIKRVEDRGDDITHEIVKLLNATFVTPLDREDILTMASRLDDVIDRIDAAAARLLLFRIKAPTEHARTLSRVLCLTCEQVSEALVHFQRRRFAEVAQACVEINRLENEGDEALRQALEELYDGRFEALEVMKWKEIYETLEEAIDRCEDVSDVLETVTLKNA
ncbi:MAG: DUF47 family protein [Bacillota bacterium]